MDGSLHPAFRAVGSPSFSDFITSYAPELMPGAAAERAAADGTLEAVHGTTIVTAVFDGGVVMAGDRRATMGNIIAQKTIEKVFAADDHCVVGIAGTAGLAIELVRFFSVELEHYEKIEGLPLSLDGKANRLSTLLRGNLSMAMQGLTVVPLLAGFDTDRNEGRIYSYDVTGGRYEEQDYHSVGSGSLFAKGSLKKVYSRGLDAESAVSVCLQALYDAADDDSATGGPDLTRGIFPVVYTVTADGAQRLSEERVATLARRVVDARMTRPDGPHAPLPN